MDIATEGPTEKKTCIVVDEQDQQLYIGGLAECHTRPMTLHRAFSLFVFDQQGRLLLQQRAKTKYTFPLAWTNTVCSHPRNADKSMEEWIDIRVQDELGWSIKDVQNRLCPVGKLTYSAISDFKYGEKEVDTLYYLQISEDEKQGLALNKDEVEAIDWVEPERLESMMSDDRFLITPWFRAIANGFGHPFFKNIKAMYDKQNQLEENPEETKDGNNYFIDPKTSKSLPWFRVGNCSMPSANPNSDLLLQGPFSYLTSNPGKSLRTQLVKLYSDLDTQVTEKDIDGIAWIVERIHNASLLHDDIEDKSSTRRGAVCAHLLWGTPQTINTGTFNFLRSIQGIDEVMKHHSSEKRSEMMRCVVDMLVNLHRGQNADVCWGEHALCPTIEQYIEMIDHKTGVLFKVCAELGSICTGNKQIGEQVAEQLVEIGRYFQIRDDFCNICDPKYWQAKGFYEDADEGKYSYPVLVFIENEKTLAQDRDYVVKRLADRENPMSNDEKLKIYTLLFKANALEETKKLLEFKLKGLQQTIATKSERAKKILEILNIVDIPTPEQAQKWIQQN